MKLYYVPYFCGGKFLAGLYNSSQGIEHHHQYYLNDQAKHGGISKSVSDADSYPYVPNTLLGFQQLLKLLLRVDLGIEGGQQGVVTAVTIQGQDLAMKFLPASGFKAVGAYQKRESANAGTLWVGDYRKDIFPILNIIPSFVPPATRVVANAPKFASL